ncbi:MAG: hypothetical protein KJ709_05160 [Nanoarchaeota archaeon]|nr:hypothetical protein [Nanoarchaeota archaeon]
MPTDKDRVLPGKMPFEVRISDNSEGLDKLPPEIEPEVVYKVAIELFFEQQKVFEAGRYPLYPEGAYATANWRVNPSDSIDFYVRELVKFYENIMSGGYDSAEGKKDIGAKYLRPRMRRQQFLPAGEDLGDRILGLDVSYLMFCTPYCDFGMQSTETDSEGKTFVPWTPENGLLGITSHNDVSEPLSGLIAYTSRYTIEADKIFPVLMLAFQFLPYKPGDKRCEP